MHTELGGKSAIILGDADLDSSVAMLAFSVMNSGQALRGSSPYPRPRDHATARSSKRRRVRRDDAGGHADDPGAAIGPLISEKQRERRGLHRSRASRRAPAW